jgi:Mg-chelatase subunit ChlD
MRYSGLLGFGLVAALGMATATTGCSTGDAPQSCVSHAAEVAEPAGANMLFLLDRSGSMHLSVGDTQTRWTATKFALFSILERLENRVRADVTMFPAGDEPLSCCPTTNPNCGLCLPGDYPAPEQRCDAGSYEDAELSLLTTERIDNLKSFVSSSDNDNYWGTPLAPALDGAIQSLQLQMSSGVTAVVLLTDGRPTACDTEESPEANAIDHSVEAVAAGAAAGVKTYVVGVIDGETAADASHLTALALAGDTARYDGCADSNDCAYAVTVDSFNDDLRSALEAIALDATRCTFTRPAMQGELAVNLRHGEKLTTVPHDPEEIHGWNMLPGGEIQLYGAACETVKANTQAVVEVSAACEAF